MFLWSELGCLQHQRLPCVVSGTLSGMEKAWGCLLSRAVQFIPKASGFHYAEERSSWDWVKES